MRMKAAFNKATGEYVDDEQSAQKLDLGYNPANLERLGLTADDVVVKEVDGLAFEKKLVGGRLVEDTEKLAANAAREKAVADEALATEVNRASAVAKLTALKFSPEEIAALFGHTDQRGSDD